MQPEMSDDQRLMAVTMLANAIRKDAHLRERARQASDSGNPLRAVMATRRSEPSQRYIDGMCDMIKVLFANGSAEADACLEDAYAHAIGAAPPPAGTSQAFH